MMQHADRIDEVKTFEGKRRVVKISLYRLHVFRFGVAARDFHGWTEIDGPDFRAVFGCVVSEATVAATCVEHLLAAKELRPVWLHVVEKLAFPLVVHLGKALPLVTKTQRRLDLFRIHSRCGRLAGK